ncbi:hypothetical protein Avbf_01588 [Armadillidium vulgare]|nr:hypothetical protein Avbf_01588 [Armadillidium vulgare]
MNIVLRLLSHAHDPQFYKDTIYITLNQSRQSLILTVNKVCSEINKTFRFEDESWHEDDALILRVIEYYCTSAKTRYTVNSIDLGQVGRSCHSSGGGQNTPLPSCLASTPTSPPLSPFGDMRMIKGGDSNWCCGLAMKAIKRNIDLDC